MTTPPTDEAWRPIDVSMATLVLLAFGALVLVRSHYFGFVTDDASGYLALAQNLVSGHGFHQQALGKPDQLFSIWPVGYGTLIAGVAALTGLPVFEASKLLNILLAGVNLMLLQQIFGRNFPTFAWLLLLPPMVQVSSQTWSEVPFITGMLGLAVIAGRFVDGRVPPWRGALGMAASVALMFLSRYVGSLGIGVIALVALHALVQGERRKFWATGAATAATALGVVAYLYNNLREVGHATGMQRLPAPEPASWRVAMTVKAYLKQLNLLVADADFDTGAGRLTLALTSAVLVAAVVYVVRDRGKGTATPPAAAPTSALPLLLAGVGLTYLAAITVLRWLTQFDNLSMRLLFPGAWLVMLGLLHKLQQANSGTRERLQRITPWVVAAGLATLLAGDVQTWQAQAHPRTQAQVQADVLASATNIPRGSIVAFGDSQLAYLRQDLLLVRPQFKPLHPVRESWEDFEREIRRHAGGRPVFVFIETDLDPQRFDPSVIAFMAQHRPGTLVRILPD